MEDPPSNFPISIRRRIRKFSRNSENENESDDYVIYCTYLVLSNKLDIEFDILNHRKQLMRY